MWKLCLIVAAFVLCAGCAASGGKSAAEAPIRIFAMGDIGTASVKQQTIAKTLAKYAETHPASGVLLAGDNVYLKLTGVDDPQWKAVFEDMYDFPSLKIPFYAVPGNHDYQFGKLPMELGYAAAHPGTRWTMPSTYYRVDLPKEKPLVTILMLDSNQPLMPPEQWAAELEWIKTQLAETTKTGQWVIACAHHPLYSNGNHGDNGILQNAWGPLFKKYNLPLYVCGHDHDLQHLEIPGNSTSFILVGGGGANTRPIRRAEPGPFYHSANGFSCLEFTPNLLTVHLLDTEAGDLHMFTRTRDGKMTIVSTTANDQPTTRTVKSVTRDDEKKD